MYHIIEAPWKQESVEVPGPQPLLGKQEPGRVGMPKPPYLSIEGHRDCMKTVSLGSMDVICLHPIRPQNCKDKAWNALVKLNETQDIMTCPTEGMFNSGLLQ